jgi:hypothetical protein
MQLLWSVPSVSTSLPAGFVQRAMEDEMNLFIAPNRLIEQAAAHGASVFHVSTCGVMV